MTFEKALIALKSGNKIRLTDWESREFICLESDGKKDCIVNEVQFRTNLTSGMILSDNWEVINIKKKKQVYQWRFKNENGDWSVLGILYGTIEEVKEKFSPRSEYEIHAGPWDVEE